MKVTPIKKKFGKHDVGTVFELPDRAARIFIKAKKLEQVTDAPAAPTYQTRMMTAEQVSTTASRRARVEQTRDAEADPAPYGYKADGTPRKRPAPAPRKKAAE